MENPVHTLIEKEPIHQRAAGCRKLICKNQQQQAFSHW